VVRNKVEELIQRSKSSNDAMDLLISNVMNIDGTLGNIVPTTVTPAQEEYENFVGCKIPNEIHIHPPNDARSKGRSKRIKRAKEQLNLHKRKNAKNLI
jgi:hypothetical protein